VDEDMEDRFDASIRAYYDQRSEEDRLTRGASQLEAERTCRLLERLLPPTPATVLDIGGAAGFYALWLSGRGYEVHLLDPVGRLVEEARRRSRSVDPGLASSEVGDARQLPFEDASADVVLLLGPLYHLTERTDRVRALSEARRVLRPGGMLFAAAINRWASAFDALAKNYFEIPGRSEIVARALRDGQHRNVDGAGGFTTAYFHRPEELQDEASEAGFGSIALYALEGPAGFYPDFDERWADAEQRANILRLAEATEREPSLMGASPHLLLVAENPGG